MKRLFWLLILVHVSVNLGDAPVGGKPGMQARSTLSISAMPSPPPPQERAFSLKNFMLSPYVSRNDEGFFFWPWEPSPIHFIGCLRPTSQGFISVSATPRKHSLAYQTDTEFPTGKPHVDTGPKSKNRMASSDKSTEDDSLGLSGKRLCRIQNSTGSKGLSGGLSMQPCCQARRP